MRVSTARVPTFFHLSKGVIGEKNHIFVPADYVGVQ
jgi:hypothetical protein